MSKLKRQHSRSLAAACLGCTALVLVLHFYSLRYRRIEWKTRDALAEYGRRSPAREELIFLAIDNASTTLDSTLGDEIDQSPALQKMAFGFPFPRDFYALVIERLAQAGAKVIAFDILFPSEKDADGPFREALEKYADKVLIGANLEQRDVGAPAGGQRFRHTLVKPSHSLIPPSERMDSRVGFVNFWGDPDDQLVRRATYRTTTLTLDPPPDLDVRSLTPEEAGDPMTSFAARILEKMGRGDRIPAGREPVMFRFAEEARPFSLHQIFVDRFWNLPPFNRGEMFRGKVVLIGPDGNAQKDELPTPFGPMLGPRLHLSAVNAALAGDFLRETSTWENIILILEGGLIAWVIGRFVQNPMTRLAVLAALVVAMYGAAQMLFNHAGILPLVLSPLLSLVASAGTFSVVEQFLDRQEKAKLRKTFERLVSKDIVKELVDNPQGWLSTKEGRRIPITILFSDVRGFTTLTETADPHALVKQLNEYFDDMVEIVFANQGTLDKFIGDAVMAYWGGIRTEGVETDARRAVAAAVQMRKTLARVNPDWKARGMLELQIGIGVNHGHAIVAEIGSKEKAEITVISDAVNVGSRLEGITKQYHIDLCISETVEPFVRDTFILRSLDLILAKGKTKPVEIFAVLDERGPGVADPAWLPRHEEAVKLYRAGDFPAAETAWREVLAQAPGDSIAEVFLARCAELRASPPEGKWDGVFEMKSK